MDVEEKVFVEEVLDEEVLGEKVVLEEKVLEEKVLDEEVFDEEVLGEKVLEEKVLEEKVLEEVMEFDMNRRTNLFYIINYLSIFHFFGDISSIEEHFSAIKLLDNSKKITLKNNH
jgi:archaellum biogenesis ATPase FlaH